MWAIWELVFRVRCFWQVSWTWGLYMWKRITFNSSPLSYPCPFRHSRHPASCALTSASTRGRSPSSASTAAKPSPRTQPTTATCGARTARRRAALARCAASTSRSRRITTSTWRFMPLISQEPCGSGLDLAHVCIGLCACVFAWLCARRKRWIFTLTETLWVCPVSGPWAYFWVQGTGVSRLGTLIPHWVEVEHVLPHLSLPLLPYPNFHKREKHRQEGISSALNLLYTNITMRSASASLNAPRLWTASCGWYQSLCEGCFYQAHFPKLI